MVLKTIKTSPVYSLPVYTDKVRNVYSGWTDLCAQDVALFPHTQENTHFPMNEVP